MEPHSGESDEQRILMMEALSPFKPVLGSTDAQGTFRL